MSMILKVGREFYEVESTSPKSIGRKRTDHDDMKTILKNFGQALNPSRDTNAYNKAKSKYKTVKKNFGGELQKHLNKLMDGKYSKKQFQHHVRKEFKKAYYRAFELGTESTGINLDYVKLPKSDYAWLDRARSGEYKYLDKFIDDVINGDGTMDYSKRMSMYQDTLDSLFDAGRVDAMPSEGTTIYWILSAEESCPDCLELASDSPYIPNELPSTPRAGDTRCLSNCQCTLRITYDPPKEVTMKVGKYSGNVADAIDWNVIDDIRSVLYEVDEIKRRGLIKEGQHAGHSYLLEKLDTAVEQLNVSLDPRGREFILLHRLGAMIRDEQLQINQRSITKEGGKNVESNKNNGE